MPPDLALSVRLHRRIDAVTDRHPQVQAARAGFAHGERRYAGILLDLLYDHLLAQDWAHYSAEALPDFATRASRHVVRESRWFEQAGGPVPQAAPFSALLVSYGSEAGLEQAVRRTAQRLKKPQGLLDAMVNWRERLPQLRTGLPILLADLRDEARRYAISDCGFRIAE